MRVAVITLSDSAAAGIRIDESGPAIIAAMEAAGYRIVHSAVLPDDEAGIRDELARICDEGIADLILTTGGTGFSLRDHTPEATIAVCDRLAPGIAEAIRAESLKITPLAMLSRAAAGIRKNTLIINLPGSPKAVKECLAVILGAIGHGLAILTGTAENCARPE